MRSLVITFASRFIEAKPEKNSDIIPFSAYNIDCGNSLEPPRQGGSNEYHNICIF